MVCLPGEYGTNNAAVVATNLKRTFPRIHATLMVGISSSCPSQADLYLGDVVVGTRVMQYNMGKVVGGCFQETAVPKTSAPLLNAAVVIHFTVAAFAIKFKQSDGKPPAK
ncbi:nacht and ankyrin domain protein [Colletotrichum chrysophilum]|uniref:Nacht and ankyrin domain protein n=1 Tax=Colletotrichum chrysophilum TaxID=1836956 RepID=A0AAD9A2B7_9PEZI|nr:nacht and ankyrin domain protein [Colletotrichum chrysophilum]